MDDKCDHCGQRAYTWWWRADDKAELSFCGHCTRGAEKALRESRFTLMRDRRSELIPDPTRDRHEAYPGAVGA